jgi:hypothetical protein
VNESNSIPTVKNKAVFKVTFCFFLLKTNVWSLEEMISFDRVAIFVSMRDFSFSCMVGENHNLQMLQELARDAVFSQIFFRHSTKDIHTTFLPQKTVMLLLRKIAIVEAA